MPHKARPVPPIYQPEIAAKAIYWAAHHRRREIYVGAPTVKSIQANKVIPGLLDRFLARKGYSGQQTNEPRDPYQPNNLWEPVDGAIGVDHGAHGEFDARARASSPELWAALHREWIGALAGGLAGIGLGFSLARRSRW